MSGLVAYDDDVNGRTEADRRKGIPYQRNGFILSLELVGDGQVIAGMILVVLRNLLQYAGTGPLMKMMKRNETREREAGWDPVGRGRGPATSPAACTRILCLRLRLCSSPRPTFFSAEL